MGKMKEILIGDLEQIEQRMKAEPLFAECLAQLVADHASCHRTKPTIAYLVTDGRPDGHYAVYTDKEMADFESYYLNDPRGLDFDEGAPLCRVVELPLVTLTYAEAFPDFEAFPDEPGDPQNPRYHGPDHGQE